MLIVTTEGIAQHRIVETRGQVFGVMVHSRGLGGNIMAGLRSPGGGEIKEYTRLLEDVRRHAIDRMVQMLLRWVRTQSCICSLILRRLAPQ